jgi:hypothetical protein
MSLLRVLRASVGLLLGPFDQVLPWWVLLGLALACGKSVSVVLELSKRIKAYRKALRLCTQNGSRLADTSCG